MEFESLFTSAIEVGIGIAGFSGIVAVLSHRNFGEWSRGDRGRMVILLQTSFATVLLAFLPLLLHGAMAEGAMLWQICSAVYIAYTAKEIVVRTPRVRELRKDPANEINDSYVRVIIVLLSIALALQLANIFWLRTGWPYAVAVLWTMTLSFTQFVRLMRVLWTSKSR